MTDNEIIKALECCNVFDSCPDECPFHSKDFSKKLNCLDEKEGIMAKTLDLINRQKAEIERLQKANGLLKYLKEAVHRIEIGGKEEVVEYASDEAFHNAITNKINLMCNVQTAKSEAYKEFAERLCEGRVSNDPVVIAARVELSELTERKEDEGE